MKLLNAKTMLIIIFLLGIFLRFFMLGVNPPSLNWDEVSTGYNAYSILKTGKDEYGNYLPLSIRSFDDYKPALYTYLTVPSLVMFGVNDFAVRFPSALLGSFTIIVVYYLVKEILTGKKFTNKQIEYVSLTSALFFAISPWSLQFSRAAYEGNIGLFFLLAGVLFLFKFLKKPAYLFLSIPFFVLSLYSYHSFRLVVPLFLIGFFIFYFTEFIKNKSISVISIILIILLVIPIYSSFLFSDAGTGSRLSMVTIFGNTPELEKSIERLEYDKSINNSLGYVFNNRRVVYGLAFIKGYLDHYNPDFLFLHGDGGRQHHAVDFGMLYLFSLPIILIGIYTLIFNFTKRIGVIFLLMILAPLASAISTGSPHPVRAIIMAPIFEIFAAVGVVILFEWVKKIKIRFIKYSLFAVLFLTVIVNVLYYFNQYYVHTPREYGDFWQYGNREAIEYAKENEDSYEKIIMTYYYDQPYVYYLFYNMVDPAWYQKNWNFTGDGVMPRFERKIGKYEFRKIDYGKDKELKNTLLIGTPEEIPNEAIVLKRIDFPNGVEAYRIVAN